MKESYFIGLQHYITVCSMVDIRVQQEQVLACKKKKLRMTKTVHPQLHNIFTGINFFSLIKLIQMMFVQQNMMCTIIRGGFIYKVVLLASFTVHFLPVHSHFFLTCILL